jgi:hypothetical protein
MGSQHSIREQLADACMWPATDDQFGDEVKVGARIDLVSDARSDDRQNGRSAFTASIEPREQPIFPADHQTPDLTFAPVVC